PLSQRNTSKRAISLSSPFKRSATRSTLCRSCSTSEGEETKIRTILIQRSQDPQLCEYNLTDSSSIDVHTLVVSENRGLVLARAGKTAGQSSACKERLNL